MNCSEARDLLSTLHDGELSTDLRESVTAHVRACPDCAVTLADIESLSALLVAPTQPSEPPPGLWDQLETTLDAEEATAASPPAAEPSHSRSRRQRVLLAVALSLFAVAGLSLYMQRPGLGRHDEHLAVNFDEFLNHFPESAERAQDLLHASYPAELVDVEAAALAVKYRPAIANDLPEGYSVDSVHLVRMPCCLCVESLCTAPDGTRLAILEHAIDQPVWFGERPVETCRCNNKQARLVAFNGRYAATWQSKQGFLTVVGIRDEQQLQEIMSHIDPSSEQIN